MEPEQTPQKARSSSKRRRKRKPTPPKTDWVLPTIGVSIGVLLLVVLILLVKDRFFPADPEVAVAEGSTEIAQDLQDFYKGNYTLIDNSTLIEKKLLPEGIAPAPRANQLRSNWGEVVIMGANPEGRTQPPYTHFLISYDTIPSGVCSGFIPTLMARYERIWILPKPGTPGPTYLVGSAGEIQARCAQGQTVSIMALGK